MNKKQIMRMAGPLVFAALPLSLSPNPLLLTTGAQELSDAKSITFAESYEQIYDALHKFADQYDDIMLYTGDDGYDAGFGMIEEKAVLDYEMDAASGNSSFQSESSSASSGDFSNTNIAEKGVDEGDIVKTDGVYIYVLRPDLTLAIYEAAGKDSSLVSLTDLSGENTVSIREMYLDGDRLSIITSEYTTELENDNYIYYTDSKRQTRLSTYDISNCSTPVLLGSITQDGSYKDSRKTDSNIYLFTAWYPDIQNTFEESTITPRVNQIELSADSFFLPKHLQESTCLVISSIDIAAPKEIVDSKVLVSGVTNFYVSPENIYIANEDYSENRTDIVKFHYQDGLITGKAAGSVHGSLNDTFSMNEYEGNLRVVATYYGDQYNKIRELVSNFTNQYYEQNWTRHNALYVLDEDLNKIGSIDGLAKDETIRSARFMGNTGYFVTFRQTDPLFAVDLSAPHNPVLSSELKLSGYSSYLHFYGKDRLLGIGYEADESTGMTTGLKLSMFDISDPADLTELHRFTIPGVTWCPAIENYKCILADPEKNLIGFFCDNRYMVFSYDDASGFERELLYDFYADMLNGQVSFDTLRGLYIGDNFYLAGNIFLLSFDMTDHFAKTFVDTGISFAFS